MTPGILFRYEKEFAMANQNNLSSKKENTVTRDALGRKKSSGHTGPKSAAGKNHAKLNALKHARYAKTKILPYEDESEYQALVQELYEDISPQGSIECDLVNQYIDSRWRSQRMEGRIHVEQDSIFARMDKTKMAAMLEIDESFYEYLPDYLFNMSKRFGPKQIETADIAWRQYCRMIKEYDSNEFTNLEEIRIHFDVLFEEFEKWVRNQKGLPPLLTPLREKLNAPWLENDAQLLFDMIHDFAVSMYFQAIFMSWKEQIRNWLQVWYFLQKRELREIDQYDLALIKEIHLQHTILERLAKIQKQKRDSHMSLQAHFPRPNSVEGEMKNEM